MTRSERDLYVKKVVDSAPPLPAALRDELAVLLRPDLLNVTPVGVAHV